MKIRFKYCIALVSILWSLEISASPQVPDYIIVRGDTIATYHLLLEAYLQKFDTLDSQMLFGLTFREGASTSCWRGYQAIYLLQEGNLFLVDIIECGALRSKKIDKVASSVRMNAIFGKGVKDNKVLIDWFSGDISFSIDNNILRWDGVFSTVYEKETVVTLASGKVTEIKDVVNYEDDPNAINRKDKSKISKILFKKLKKIKWKKVDDCDCSEKYLITIDEKGLVSKVTMIGFDTDEEIDKYWERDDYAYCLTTMLTGLKGLRFDIIKNRGKPVSEEIYLEIWTTDKGRIENWTF